MRALILSALVLLSVTSFAAEESAAELARKLTTRLAAAEAEANKQKSPETGLTGPLRQTSLLIRQLDRPELLGGFVQEDAQRQLQESLAGFPDLQTLAAQWLKVRFLEHTAREKVTVQEIENGIREAAMELKKAEKSTDIDGAVAKLSELRRTHAGDFQGTGSSKLKALAAETTDLQKFAHQFQGVFIAEQNGNPRDAVEQLRALFQRSSVSGFSSSELWDLFDRRARKLGVPTVDEAESAVRKIIASAVASTKPTELDALLRQVLLLRDVWSETSHFRNLPDRRPNDFAECAQKFVMTWQECMVYRAAGRFDEARNAVRKLIESAGEEPLYARTILLQAAAKFEDEPTGGTKSGELPVSTAETKLAKIETLDDLMAQLPALKDSLEHSGGGELFTIASDLSEIAQGYAGLQAGDLGSAKMATFGGFNNHPKVAKLRGQLSLRMAAAAFNAKGDQAPRGGENVAAYLRRLTSEMQKTKDWARLRELFEKAAQFPAFHGILSHNESTGLRYFIAAKNLDTAGVRAAAVESYIASLKSGSTIVPVEEIKQQLETIRREHPEDFKSGSERPASPSNK